jgi:hypothetical protein
VIEASGMHPEPFYVCCHCVPDEKLDYDASFLMRKHCTIHGECWHRHVVIGPDGVVKLALSVMAEVKVEKSLDSY